MKKILVFFFTLCLILSMVGCKDDHVPAETTAQQTDASSAQTIETTAATEERVPVISSQIPMSSVYVPVVKEEHKAKDGTVLLTHEYQSMSLTLQDPDVADKVILDFLNRVDSKQSAAEKMLKSVTAVYDDGSFTLPYYCGLVYAPTRIDQGVLSLFGAYTEYSGGNHGSTTNLSANYDLAHGDVLTLASILKIGADPNQFEALVLKQLDAKADGLYAEYQNFIHTRFTRDLSQDEGFFFTATGIDFYFSPYEIAPYAAGTILVEIPYSDLVGLIDDAFFPAEKDETSSTVTAVSFDSSAFNKYNQITEAVVDKDGTRLLLSADDTVQNIQLMEGSPENSTGRIIFAAQALSPGDAIMLQATSEHLASMNLLYTNKDGTHELSLAIN